MTPAATRAPEAVAASQADVRTTWQRFRTVALAGVPEWRDEYVDAEIAYEHALARRRAAEVSR